MKFKIGHTINKGRHLSEEHKRKIGIKSRKCWKNLDYRRRVIEGHIGHKTSKETRTKIALANKGKHCSEEAKQKMRIKRLANPSYYWLGKKRPDIGEKIRNKMKGRIMSEEQKKKISKTVKEKNLIKYTQTSVAKRNLSIYMKNKWRNDSVYRDTRRRILMKSMHQRPTKPEKSLMDLIKKYNLPFKYVGDGEIIIEGFNPDFINSNGSKEIIEVNSEYWHRLPKIMERDQRKIEIYKKYGYKTLTLWEYELTKNFDENSIIEKIKNFCDANGKQLSCEMKK